MLKYRTCEHLTPQSVHLAADAIRALSSATAKVQLTALSCPYKCVHCDRQGKLDDEAFRRHFAVSRTTDSSQAHSLCVRLCQPCDIYCFRCEGFQFCTDFDLYVARKRPRLPHTREPNSYRDLIKQLSAERTKSLVPASSKKHRPHGRVKGICNMGNTCFMSTMLQLLLHNPILMSKNLLHQFDISCKINFSRSATFSAASTASNVLNCTSAQDSGEQPANNCCVFCQFKKLHNSAFSSNGEVLTPSDLLFTMWSSIGYMAGYRQQDAHEFLIGFIDALDDHSKKYHTNSELLSSSPRISPRARTPLEVRSSPRFSQSAINGSAVPSAAESVIEVTRSSSGQDLSSCESSGSAVVFESPSPYFVEVPISSSTAGGDFRNGHSLAKLSVQRASSDSSSRRNAVDSLLLSADKPQIKDDTSDNAAGVNQLTNGSPYPSTRSNAPLSRQTLISPAPQLPIVPVGVVAAPFSNQHHNVRALSPSVPFLPLSISSSSSSNIDSNRPVGVDTGAAGTAGVYEATSDFLNRGIVDLFSGWTESKLTCKACRGPRRKREMFVDLNLTVSSRALKKLKTKIRNTNGITAEANSSQPFSKSLLHLSQQQHQPQQPHHQRFRSAVLGGGAGYVADMSATADATATAAATSTDANGYDNTSCSVAVTTDEDVEDFSKNSTPLQHEQSESIDHLLVQQCSDDEGNEDDDEDLEEVSLADCMRFYSTVENLTEKVHCDDCGRQELMEKQMSIISLPDVLVLQLKRFDYLKNRKIRTKVQIPLRDWDISEFTTNANVTGDISTKSSHQHQQPQQLSQSPLYDLQGIVCHSGNLNQGHYISYIADYVQTPFGPINYQWLKCDDEHITVVSDEVVLEAEGYVLFYVNQRMVAKAEQ